MIFSVASYCDFTLIKLEGFASIWDQNFLNFAYDCIIHFFSGDSASTGAAQKFLEGSDSEELPALEIPETATLPSEGVEYSNLSTNQIKQVMDKLTGLVYRRIRE